MCQSYHWIRKFHQTDNITKLLIRLLGEFVLHISFDLFFHWWDLRSYPQITVAMFFSKQLLSHQNKRFPMIFTIYFTYWNVRQIIKIYPEQIGHHRHTLFKSIQLSIHPFLVNINYRRLSLTMRSMNSTTWHIALLIARLFSWVKSRLFIHKSFKNFSQAFHLVVGSAVFSNF